MSIHVWRVLNRVAWGLSNLIAFVAILEPDYPRATFWMVVSLYMWLVMTRE